MEQAGGTAAAGYEERLQRLYRIRAGAEPYGDARNPADAAQAYQIDAMLDDIAGFARRNSDPMPGQVDLLISLVGFSPITTLLSYELLRPARILVISSATADRSINVIHRNLMHRHDLEMSRFKHWPCEPTDPQSIYRIIRDELARTQISRGCSVIDITGGRKVMSASAALAAWQLDLELCYLESEFDRDRQINRPETNRMHMLRNPLTIFGEQEMARAMEQFNAGAFSGAEERFGQLAQSVDQPAQARFMHALSALYRCWCDLDFGGELTRAAAAVRTLKPAVAPRLGPGIAARIEEQLTFLGRLASGDQQAVLLNYFLLGRHYRDAGRRDFAALLYYRTVEKCLSLRLEARDGFRCGKPDYRLLAADTGRLADAYATAAAGVWQGAAAPAVLPDRVALMNSALLLHVLGDPCLRKAGLDGTGDLRTLSRLAEVRNQSVLAHGNAPVGADDLQQLARLAGRMLDAYWSLEGGAPPLHELRERLAFVRPRV